MMCVVHVHIDLLSSSFSSDSARALARKKRERKRKDRNQSDISFLCLNAWAQRKKREREKENARNEISLNKLLHPSHSHPCCYQRVQSNQWQRWDNRARMLFKWVSMIFFRCSLRSFSSVLFFSFSPRLNSKTFRLCAKLEFDKITPSKQRTLHQME